MAIVIPIQYCGFAEYNENPSTNIDDRSITREDSNDGDSSEDGISKADENMTDEEKSNEETPSISSPADTSAFFDGDALVYPSDDVFNDVDDKMEIDLNDYELYSDLPSIPGPATTTRFGGLSNMGNTCYMNSALQMLASLDEFTADIQTVAVPVEESDKLRRALKDVLGRLENGETVRPEEFKRSIDERTSLFLGYRQQDSHEFLTTLLDLIDEDFKRKQGDENMKKSQAGLDEKQAASNGSEGSEGAMGDGNEIASDSGEDKIVKEVESDSITHENQLLDENDDGGSGDCRGLGRVTNFVDLQFGDIEHLLHGGKMSIDPSSEGMVNDVEREEPKCKLLGGRMNTAGVEFTRYEQQPTHDDVAATNISQEASKPQESDDDITIPTTIIKSPIESNFTTEVRVCLTCESCKYRRSHTETFLHLSLEIGPRCSSIEDGLRKFFAPEKREIKCEKCFHSSALQTSEITKLPRALLFHLKRFIVDVSPDYTSISYRKDQSPVSFEEKIELSRGDVIAECLAPEVVIPEGFKYKIRSVVNHIGASASCGHYTADAKRQYGVGEEGREWTRFNDSIVTKISSQNAVENSARTAYMIMYEIEE